MLGTRRIFRISWRSQDGSKLYETEIESKDDAAKFTKQLFMEGLNDISIDVLDICTETEVTGD